MQESDMLTDNKRMRRSIRLQGYDYSQECAYFITICTYNRKCLFGEIVESGRDTKYCSLTKSGKIVETCWNDIPHHFPHVLLDEYVVMPNHIHGIIVITNNSVRFRNSKPRQKNDFQHIIPCSIGSIVRGFKIGVTKWFWANTAVHAVWQRNYYEHIIRDEKSLQDIREYIVNNPVKWDEDENNIHVHVPKL